MNDQKILEKIAYAYHKKFQGFGQLDDRERDWRYATRALIHLKKPINWGDGWWRFHEDDYGEFRQLLEEL